MIMVVVSQFLVVVMVVVSQFLVVITVVVSTVLAFRYGSYLYSFWL